MDIMQIANCAAGINFATDEQDSDMGYRCSTNAKLYVAWEFVGNSGARIDVVVISLNIDGFIR